MRRTIEFVRNFLSDERGVSLSEYASALAVLAAVGMFAGVSVGTISTPGMIKVSEAIGGASLPSLPGLDSASSGSSLSISGTPVNVVLDASKKTRSPLMVAQGN